MLAVDVGIALGFWVNMGKFQSGFMLAPTPSFAPIDRVTASDPSLAGQPFFSLTTMGSIDPIENIQPGNFDQALLTQTISLNDEPGNLLLSAALTAPGEFNVSFTTDSNGAILPLNFGGHGFFDVTGGSLAGLGIFQNGPLYTEFSTNGPFSVISNGADIYANTSTFKFYASSGPHQEVPEPATVMLMGAGLVSAGLRRRKSAR